MLSLQFVHFHARAGRLRALSPIGLALALIAASSATPAQSQPLTLAQAQQQAIARSRQLNAQDLAAVAAHEMAAAAGQLPDPVLKFGVDNLPVSGPDRLSLGNDSMTMRRVGVSQELTAADKRHWRAARLEREADKAQTEKVAAVAAIQRDTAIAWLDVFYTERMAAVLAAQAATARQEIEAAEAAYRGGRGSQADILAARAALLTLDDRGSDIGRRLRVAQTMLARWTGGETGVASAPDIDSIRLNPASLERDFTHHPQVSLLNQQERIAQADLNLARANGRADWSVELAFQQRGSTYPNMVSIGLSVPLQWDRKNRQDREVAAKAALVGQATATRDELLRSQVAETRAQIVEWQSGKERIARYTRDLLPLAAERSAATLSAYRSGKAALAEVLAARRNEAETQLQALQLKLETARLWAQLNFLLPEGAGAQHGAMNQQQESK